MSQVVVGVGSNQERENNICAALDALSAQFGELIISPVYESMSNSTDVQENENFSYYYNLVVAFNTQQKVDAVKHCLQQIESHQGRQRNVGEVSIDLDLLLYGDWVGELEGNAIPHHDITHCEYVLRPLSDLFPDQLHPVYCKPYSDLWMEYEKKKITNPVDFVWNDSIVSNASFLPPF